MRFKKKVEAGFLINQYYYNIIDINTSDNILKLQTIKVKGIR